MGEIVTYKSVSINELMSNLDRYKYNPSSIQRVILDYLSEVTNGEVDIVDPTNPFVFLLESSSVNTALAINENFINLRKQYPSLSQTENELYMHLSDKDFLNRFATPAETDFTVVIQVNDLLNKMVYDPVEKCHKATIPRDTQFHIEELIFTLQYPIVIRKYDNGVVQLSYDASIVSPIETLTGNIIDYVVRRDTSLVDWLFFKVRVSQFEINTSYYPLQKSILFSNDIVFKDQFYYVRAFYRNTDTLNQWEEILTTHTDQVFDSSKPTVVVKAYDRHINVSIPIVYLTSQLLSGEIRFDVYTTKGQMTVNLANYKLNSFKMKLIAIDEERDLDDYTSAMSNLSFYGYSDQLVSGGTNGIDFKTLRERVIFNSVGEQQLPITNVQLEAFVNNKGFDLVRNVDVLTNRIFLATQKLPKPLNTKLITSANIGISTFISNIAYLKTLSTIKDNVDRVTILSKNIFINENGIIRLLTTTEIDAINVVGLNAKIAQINNSQYLYNPFYYVLDSTKREFEVRAYNLDYPVAMNLSFIAQNQSLQLPVNTKTYNLTKISNGYRLTVYTKSGNFYKQLPDGQVFVQLGFYSSGETDLAYINGVLAGKTDEDERIYTFDIVTNYDVSDSDKLCITNAKMFTNEDLETWVDLTTQFHILYGTTSITPEFKPDNTDSLLGKFMLSPTSVGNTHETIDLELGTALKNLWTRSRSLATGLEYEKYELDVPMLYEKDVYAINPSNGSIFTVNATTGELEYNILHHRYDPVLDEHGQPVYKHRKGEIKLDVNDNPVIITSLDVDKELDLLFVDGKYFFADDSSFVSYKDEIAAILDVWITEDIKDIQTRLLEQTKIFFYPKTTLGKVKILTENGGEDYIWSEQSFTVDLYVSPTIYNDNSVRQLINENTIKLLDSFISGTVVNMTEITIALKELYGDTVLSIQLSGLGGSKDYKIVALASEHNRLCLKKNLVAQQDNSLIIKEDVVINFNRVT